MTPGDSRRHLGTPGHSWGHPETPGDTWAFLGTPRDFQRHLGTPGDSWRHLGTPGDSRRHLRTPGHFWRVSSICPHPGIRSLQDSPFLSPPVFPPSLLFPSCPLPPPSILSGIDGGAPPHRVCVCGVALWRASGDVCRVVLCDVGKRFKLHFQCLKTEDESAYSSTAQSKSRSPPH